MEQAAQAAGADGWLVKNELSESLLTCALRSALERKRHAQRVDALINLGKHLLNPPNPEQALADALRQTARYLRIEHCTLNLLDRSAQQLLPLAAYHQNAPGSQEPQLLESLLEPLREIMLRGETFSAADTTRDPLIRPYYQAVFRQANYRAFAAAPCLEGEQWVGLLVAAAGQVHTWCPAELSFLRQAGDMLWLSAEKTRTQQNLRRNQERFSQALKNTSILLYTTDASDRFTWIFNPQSELNAEAWIGKRGDEIGEPQHFREILALHAAVLSSAKGQRREISAHWNGEPRIFDMAVEPLINPHGQVTGLAVAAIDITQSRTLEAHLNQAHETIALQREVNRHCEDERHAIARSLQNGPVQSLIEMIFFTQTALSLSSEPEVSQLLYGLRDESQKVVKDLRGLCNELLPPVLMQLGLLRAIRAHSEALHERRPDLHLVLDLGDERQAQRQLPDNLQLALYRFYQEAINNILRHAAGARNVWITLHLQRQQVIVQIQDDGPGFTLPDNWLDFAQRGHLGLVRMRELAEAFGGQLQIMARPGKGVIIRVSLPRED